ncbi:hypothetical protein [Knoellia sp. LjRoot47]|uniref:hypothetical protein n=1 Tax=Knoellia sp. LjRoot47 TaxID=3342330 RepID=UPI003ECD5470
MRVIVRALGIGLAATAALVLLTLGSDDTGDANIGAGLAVFAVLALGGFGWGLADGVRARSAGLLALVTRWALVSVLAVATVLAGLAVRSGWDRLDLDASSIALLGLLVLVPSVVGVLIGYAVRSGSRSRVAGDRVG